VPPLQGRVADGWGKALRPLGAKRTIRVAKCRGSGEAGTRTGPAFDLRTRWAFIPPDCPACPADAQYPAGVRQGGGRGTQDPAAQGCGSEGQARGP